MKGELVKEIKILQRYGLLRNYVVIYITMSWYKVYVLYSEDAGSEELLNKYKRFRNLISRLSSRECQEAQRTEKKDGQNSELEKTSVCKSKC